MSNDYSVFNSYIAGGEHTRYVLRLDLEQLARTKDVAASSRIQEKFFSRGREQERPDFWFSDDELFFFAPLFCFNDAGVVDKQIAGHDYSDFFAGFRVEEKDGQKRGVWDEEGCAHDCLFNLYDSLDGNEDEPIGGYDNVFDPDIENEDYLGFWKVGLRPTDEDEGGVAERYHQEVLDDCMIVGGMEALEHHVNSALDTMKFSFEALEELEFEGNTVEENKEILLKPLKEFVAWLFKEADAVCLTQALEWIYEYKARPYQPEEWDSKIVGGRRIPLFLDTAFLHADVYREVAAQVLLDMGRSHHEALEITRELCLTTHAGYTFPVTKRRAETAEAKFPVKKKAGRKRTSQKHVRG